MIYSNVIETKCLSRKSKKLDRVILFIRYSENIIRYSKIINR